jgi:hypothetical protein
MSNVTNIARGVDAGVSHGASCARVPDPIWIITCCMFVATFGTIALCICFDNLWGPLSHSDMDTARNDDDAPMTGASESDSDDHYAEFCLADFATPMTEKMLTTCGAVIICYDESDVECLRDIVNWTIDVTNSLKLQLGCQIAVLIRPEFSNALVYAAMKSVDGKHGLIVVKDKYGLLGNVAPTRGYVVVPKDCNIFDGENGTVGCCKLEKSESVHSGALAWHLECLSLLGKTVCESPHHLEISPLQPLPHPQSCWNCHDISGCCYSGRRDVSSKNANNDIDIDGDSEVLQLTFKVRIAYNESDHNNVNVQTPTEFLSVTRAFEEKEEITTERVLEWHATISAAFNALFADEDVLDVTTITVECNSNFKDREVFLERTLLNMSRSDFEVTGDMVLTALNVQGYGYDSDDSGSDTTSTSEISGTAAVDDGTATPPPSHIDSEHGGGECANENIQHHNNQNEVARNGLPHDTVTDWVNDQCRNAETDDNKSTQAGTDASLLARSDQQGRIDESSDSSLSSSSEGVVMV